MIREQWGDLYEGEEPGTWVVFGVDSDGAMQWATFAGPGAEAQAREYAAAKYEELRQDRPRPQLRVVRP